MFTWKVEDMVLMNEESIMYKGEERIFNCELELSREEKIAFVDSMNNGELSILLDLISKYEEESTNLPKSKHGYVYTNSLRAWLTKNDPKKLVDRDFEVGRINFFASYGGRTISQPHRSYDTYYDLVDEFFHRQLLDCLRLERNYFKEHDEYCILTAKLAKCIDYYNEAFDVNLGLCSNEKIYVYDDEWDKKRLITVDEAKLLLKKYDELEAFISRLSSNINIKY